MTANIRPRRNQPVRSGQACDDVKTAETVATRLGPRRAPSRRGCFKPSGLLAISINLPPLAEQERLVEVGRAVARAECELAALRAACAAVREHLLAAAPDGAPVQQKVVEYLEGIGWRPLSRQETSELRVGRMGEPLVEPLLVDALRRLNSGLREQEALQVVDQLRRVTDSESLLKLLRDGLDIAFTAEKESRHVALGVSRDI